MMKMSMSQLKLRTKFGLFKLLLRPATPRGPEVELLKYDPFVNREDEAQEGFKTWHVCSVIFNQITRQTTFCRWVGIGDPALKRDRFGCIACWPGDKAG